ncbi:MAG: polysaccharide deacetylase family protein [Candidatus Acidiferrales bacterium]
MVRRILSNAVGAMVERAPVTMVLRLMGIPVVGFMYHVVSEKQLPHIRHLYSYKTPDALEEDVRFIKQTFNLVSFEELLLCVSNGRRWAKPIAFISFDDGMAECFQYARPILLEHHVPCIFFISTGFIGNKMACYRHMVSLCIERVVQATSDTRSLMLRALRDAVDCAAFDVEGFVKWIKGLKWADRHALDVACRTLGVDERTFLQDVQPYMTVEQLTQLASDGFALGGHGRVHVQLGQVQQPELEAEIVESCKIIREISKAERVPFAFPFSGSGVDRRLLCDIMARNPFISLVFDTQEFAKDQRFIVNRIGADEPSRLGPNVGTAASVVRQACIREIQLRFGVT